MLERIAIDWFQKWKRRVVEFDPFVTVLYGPSEAGKSSIIRACEWVATNRPTGEEFLGDWGRAPHATAQLTMDGGKTVTRRRGSGFNAYRVGSGPTLRMRNVEVPQAVDNVLNLGEVNFQGQHDGPFWFTLPAPEVSRRLNGIINLGDIDLGLTNAAGGLRTARTARTVAEERLRDAVAERDALAWVPDAVTAVRRMEGIARERDAAAARAAGLRFLYRDLSIAYGTAKNAAAAASAIDAAAQLAHRVLAAGERAVGLRRAESAIRRAEAIANAPVPDVSRIDKLLRDREAASARAHKLSTIWVWIASAEDEIKTAEEEMRCLSAELADARTCPTCGQPMPAQSPSPRATSTVERNDHLRVAIRTGGPFK